MTSIETEKVYSSDGFIVCLKTAWPGIYNIGVTNKTPSEFLNDENDSYYFIPPKPYTVVSSKRIEDPDEMKNIFYELMNKYNVFSNYERKFYKISYEELLSIIIDMDFIMWTKICKEEQDRNFNRKELTPFRFRGNTYYRNYFGHTWTNNWKSKEWVGLYNYRTKQMDTSAPEYVFTSESEYDSD